MSLQMYHRHSESKKKKKEVHVRSRAGASTQAADFPCIEAGLGIRFASQSENLSFLGNVLHDWNSQSAINLHYRVVSPCLVGANWNRLRQLLLTASLMAANERRLCAVDPYVEQDHVAAQSDGENTAQYKESLRHQSPVNSILILLTKCCPEIESNHRVWTGSSSPNGLPLADWNKAQSIEKYNNIFQGCLHCMVIMGSPLLPWHLPAFSSFAYNSRDQRGFAGELAHLWFESFSLFSVRQPAINQRKGHKKQAEILGGNIALSCVERVVQEGQPGRNNFQAHSAVGPKNRVIIPARHNWQWTQAILLIDYPGLR